MAFLWSAPRSSSAPAPATTPQFLLPCPYPCLVEAQSVSLGGDDPDIEVDQQGTIHLVWSHTDSPSSLGVYYSQRLMRTVWSTPLLIGAGTSPKIAVGLDHVIHVAWITNNYRLKYRQRSATGIWSDTSDIGPGNPDFSLVVDSQGSVHILFNCYSVAGCPSDQVLYLERLPIGSWLAPQPVGEQSKFSAMAVGPDDSIHIVWQRYGQGLFYRRRNGDGQWTAPEKAGGKGYSIHQQRIAVDQQGDIHIIFTEPANGYYLSRTPSGPWTSTPLPKAYGSADLAIDNRGNLYMIGLSSNLNEFGTYYRSKLAVYAWFAPVLVATGFSEADLPTIAVDQTGRVHIIEAATGSLHYLTAAEHMFVPLMRAR